MPIIDVDGIKFSCGLIERKNIGTTEWSGETPLLLMPYPWPYKMTREILLDAGLGQLMDDALGSYLVPEDFTLPAAESQSAAAAQSDG